MTSPLPSTFFTANRERFYDKIGGGVAVISGYSKLQRGNDAAHPFEQEANFWYLSGIEHADWWLILDGSRRHSWLVRPDVSDVNDLFDGSLKSEDAALQSGVNEVIDRDLAMSVLRGMARTHGLVYTVAQLTYVDRLGFAPNPAQRDLGEILSRIFRQVQSCRRELADLRAIKSELEIEQIKQAINLTVKAFKSVKEQWAGYKFEYEIEADFTHVFGRSGSIHAYDPIVATGKNGCTLHYTDNKSRVTKKDLTVIDIGAKVNGYAADITRTYALEPSARAQEVHDAVAHAEKEIIKLLKPNVTLREYQAGVEDVMRSRLEKLGLLESRGDYERYFPHAISHGLGIDVHDSLGTSEVLKTGMVLTVEPGIYIPEESIGVRIEDDILITDNGPVNLSRALSTAV